ncbi:MAG: organomercurial lyase [Gammaproteobacteria bacterium]
MRHLVDRGCAPSASSLAREYGVNIDVVAGALRELQDLHGVVLHPHVPEVWIAHPFSTAPTPFAVKHDRRVWWGNCAWCSLGVAALVGGNGVTIQTTLGAEGQPVTIHVDSGKVREDLWVHFPIPMTHAWECAGRPARSRWCKSTAMKE